MSGLASELSATSLYKHFKENHPDISCSYEFYRQVIKEMNISFNQPSEDKCSICLFFEMNPNEENLEKARLHNEQQKEARQAYNDDAEMYKNSSNISIFAVDMQKVQLIPRMPDIKDSFFCSRMVAFNETFASLQPGQPHLAVVWNESIRGRSV